jgi:hypothetical protein
MDFSRALALLMASSGRATSISFFFGVARSPGAGEDDFSAGEGYVVVI